jgi:tRNA(fMet)-specific endonuclease VapC
MVIMAGYLLDTDICISLIKNRYGIRNKVERVGVENCAVSEITIAELFYGAAKSGQIKHYDDVKTIIDLFKVVSVYPSLKLFGELKATLEMAGKRLDNFDLLIGSTAIHNEMDMVTSNIRHFERIPGIKLEDWCNNTNCLLLNEPEIPYGSR